MLTVPSGIIGLFTHEASVLALGISLLSVAALFQLFDGLQGVTTGVLRGLGDTRTAMISNLAAHWLFGLPLGYFLCFVAGWGVIGLWIGLSAGLVAVAVALLLTWVSRIRALRLHGIFVAVL
jgi:MATE family multidrug resistance protein